MRYWLIVVLCLAFGYWCGRADAIASPSACPHGQTHRTERKELRCLIAHARRHAGRGRVGGSHLLHHAAAHKGHDVLSCGFSHTACGRPMPYWPRDLGFCRAGTWRIGENLAEGYGSPRAVMRAWMASPTHRAIILGRWDSVGISFRGSTWVLETGACT